MRADIYEPGNAEKVLAAIRKIEEQTGNRHSFNRVVNTLISIIDSIEVVETITITLKENPETQHGGEFERKKKKKVVKQSRWVMDFK
jgi:hypothetical protein